MDLLPSSSPAGPGSRARITPNGERSPASVGLVPSPGRRREPRRPGSVGAGLPRGALVLAGLAAGILTHLVLFRRAKRQLGF
jgi:hypothetical protein